MSRSRLDLRTRHPTPKSLPRLRSSVAAAGAVTAGEFLRVASRRRWFVAVDPTRCRAGVAAVSPASLPSAACAGTAARQLHGSLAPLLTPAARSHRTAAVTCRCWFVGRPPPSVAGSRAAAAGAAPHRAAAAAGVTPVRRCCCRIPPNRDTADSPISSLTRRCTCSSRLALPASRRCRGWSSAVARPYLQRERRRWRREEEIGGASGSGEGEGEPEAVLTASQQQRGGRSSQRRTASEPAVQRGPVARRRRRSRVRPREVADRRHGRSSDGNQQQRRHADDSRRSSRGCSREMAAAALRRCSGTTSGAGREPAAALQHWRSCPVATVGGGPRCGSDGISRRSSGGGGAGEW
ncbi:hypothetical protein Scep_007865 [Stephania cephalantha]|uniref:Uncharacterized protein n=1 Tax=Stephania cephalantha TaxID=152367 RepID=A0AAP0PLI7_9MAGN